MILESENYRAAMQRYSSIEFSVLLGQIKKTNLDLGNDRLYLKGLLQERGKGSLQYGDPSDCEICKRSKTGQEGTL